MIKKIITIAVFAVMVVSVFVYKAVESIKLSLAKTGNEIVLWVPFSPQHEYTKQFENLLREFEAENEDIEITFLPITFYDYFSKIRTAQSGKKGPDVSINDILTVKYRAQNGMIKNIEQFIEKSTLVSKDDFYDVDIEFMEYNESLYAMPFSIDARFLYYNKDHLRAAGVDPDLNPPDTLERLEEYTDLLTTYEGNNLTHVGFHPEFGNNQINQMVWAQGGDFFSDNKTVNFDTEQNRETVDWWVRMVKKYQARTLNRYMNENSVRDLSPFISETVSMIVDGDWLAWDIEKYFDANPGTRFDYGVILVPYTEDNACSWSGSFTVEMSNHISSEKEEKAFRVMEYLLSPEIQSMILEMYGWRPGTISAVQGVYEEATQQQQYIFDNYDVRRHVDYIEAMPEWLIYFQSEITNATAGRVTSLEAIQAGQANLQKEIDRFYGKYNYTEFDWFGIVFVSTLVVLAAGIYAADKAITLHKKKKRGGG